MIIVDQCLCFKLETGGLIIGWLTVISNCIGVFLSLTGLIIESFLDCEYMEMVVGESFTTDDSEVCFILRGVFIGMLLFLVMLCPVFVCLGWKCIQGTKARDHSRVKPLMIVLSVCVVLTLLPIFKFTAWVVVLGLIDVIVDAYFFVVLYSLHNLFKWEYKNANNTNIVYQHEPENA